MGHAGTRSRNWPNLGGGSVFLPEAQTFFSAAVDVSTATMQGAVNRLIADLKVANLWTTAFAIYPIVGGTAAAHKFNLKDPQDLDASFRLVFTGGITHSATGMLGNGTTGFANTKFTATTGFASNANAMMATYLRNDVTGSVTDIGCLAGGNSNRVSARYATKVTVAFGSGGDVQGASLASQGFYAVDQSAAATINAYKNGSSVASGTTTGARAAAEVYILARDNAGTADEFSTRECAFAWIGNSLSAADHLALYTIVQAYQTTLGRQV